MTRLRVHLHELSHTQVGALLTAFHGPLRWTRGANPRRPCWRSERTGTVIDRATVRVLQRLGLMHEVAREGRPALELTPSGLRLADLAVSLSRQIAAGVVGLEARSFLPVVADPLPPEPEPLRLSTRRTPREVVAAQLEGRHKVRTDA